MKILPKEDFDIPEDVSQEIRNRDKKEKIDRDRKIQLYNCQEFK